MPKQRGWMMSKSSSPLWREVFPFGLLIMASIALVRQMGWLQVPELMLLDALMTKRPTEPTSEHVVLVGITEDDLNRYGGFPLSDRVLTDALKILEAAEPTAIGLDIFRDVSSDPNRIELGQYLSQSKGLIGAKVILNAEDTLNIPAAAELSPEQTGFVDVLLDPDQRLRRMILASRTWSGKLDYSLAMRLVMAALKAEKIPFRHGDRSTAPIQLGDLTIPRVTSHFGGYQKIDANGNQLMLNFSAGHPPFPILSLADVLSPNFDPARVKNKVVLVGMTAVSVKDIFYSNGVLHTVLTESLGDNPAHNGRLYGVEIHAHTVHQLLSAVQSGRPNLWAFPPWGEFILILGTGFLGGALGLWLRSPWRSLLALVITLIILGSVSLAALTEFGLWLPLLPLALIFVSTGLLTALVDRDLRRLAEERKNTIVQTYESVHNGPLQTLAILIQSARDAARTPQDFSTQLQHLNQELRGLYAQMQDSALESNEILYLQCNERLSLKLPLAQLLQVVYSTTLERSFPGFESLLIQLTPDFSGLEGHTFSFLHKRGLCLFLEEALNNVGKHGVGSIRLEVSCFVVNRHFQLQIINGFSKAMNSPPYFVAGQGTRQAERLARMLGGEFRCVSQGQQFLCQLTWPMRRSPLNRIRSIFHRIRLY